MKTYLIQIYIDSTRVRNTLSIKVFLEYRREFRVELEDPTQLNQVEADLCDMVKSGASDSRLFTTACDLTVITTELQHDESSGLFVKKDKI